ncbi:MAG: HNH endonuclease signature motif containing protein [Ilumatobacteraceae bacterium]
MNAVRTETPEPTSLSTPSLLAELRLVAASWNRNQYRLVALAAELADGVDWAMDGSPTPAHWLAAVAEVEACTAREWIRIGTLLRTLHASADAFAAGRLSYSKIRTLTRIATPNNERELLEIAVRTPASDLARALAAWLTGSSTPSQLAAHQRRQRCVRWRNDLDGTVSFFCPARTVGRRAAHRAADGPGHAHQSPSIRRGRLADVGAAVRRRTGPTPHPRHRRHHDRTGAPRPRDGCSLDDGTPIPDTVVERIAPEAFVRALIHDAERRPVNASGRQRHPTARQRRVVKERDRTCVDCGRHELLQYDHVPDYETAGHTLVEELQLRCAPCHQQRHELRS